MTFKSSPENRACWRVVIIVIVIVCLVAQNLKRAWLSAVGFLAESLQVYQERQVVCPWRGATTSEIAPHEVAHSWTIPTFGVICFTRKRSIRLVVFLTFGIYP